MNDLWKVFLGPTITLGIALVWVFLYFGGLRSDVSTLKETAAQSKQDHDAVVAMGKDIEYIKEAVTRVENAVGAERKQARNGP